MAKKKSQLVMLDHSKAKVLLLQKYLEKYLNIIANDGFTQKINVAKQDWLPKLYSPLRDEHQDGGSFSLAELQYTDYCILL